MTITEIILLIIIIALALWVLKVQDKLDLLKWAYEKIGIDGYNTFSQIVARVVRDFTPEVRESITKSLLEGSLLKARTEFQADMHNRLNEIIRRTDKLAKMPDEVDFLKRVVDNIKHTQLKEN